MPTSTDSTSAPTSDWLTPLLSVVNGMSTCKLAFCTTSCEHYSAADEAWERVRGDVSDCLTACFPNIRRWLRRGLTDALFDRAASEIEEAEQAAWALFNASPPRALLGKTVFEDGSEKPSLLLDNRESRQLRQLVQMTQAAVERLVRWGACLRLGNGNRERPSALEATRHPQGKGSKSLARRRTTPKIAPKKPTIPTNFVKPMKHWNTFKAEMMKNKKRPTYEKFSEWLRTHHGMNLDVKRFQSWRNDTYLPQLSRWKKAHQAKSSD